MRAPLRPLYAATVALARGLAAAAGDSSTSGSKFWRSVHARRGIIARWQAKAAAARDRNRPLIWLHAPSVGEGLQARPVAQALRTLMPEAQQAYSFFSPSAERFAASVGADFTDYLPFDSAADADSMLDALQPSVLVFVKLDVWPVLVERATRRSIPVMMLSATLAEGSGRRGTMSRALLRDAYAAMTAVGVVDASHGARLVDLGVNASCIHHTGDTRFDQVWERAQRVDRMAPLLRATASTRPTMVAGSTWPADEAVLLPAWESLRASVPSARIIIAPHEPTSAHLAPLTMWAERASLRHAMLGQVERGERHADETDVLIVDRVGVLGDLYTHATAAFVGGGFHKAGLHSAIEPAAFGAPVLFGPRHDMSREASLLLAAGAARSVGTVADLTDALTMWLGTDARARSACVKAGDAARAVVEQERGATERSVTLVREVVALNRSTTLTP